MMSDCEIATLTSWNVDAEIEEILLTVDNTIIEKDGWNIVVMETKSLAAEWEEISIYLGLSCDLIKGTKMLPGDYYKHWSEALNQWIKQNYNTKKFGEPSWRTLLKAIARIDKRKFKKLAADHQEKLVQNKSKADSKAGFETCKFEEKGCEDLGFMKNYAEELDATPVSCNVEESIPCKPQLSFPFLDLKKISSVEKEKLHQKLFAESEDMTYKFQQLFNKTRTSFVARRISVADLLKYLDCLGAVKPTFQGSDLPVLGCQLPELRKTESVDKAMSVISSYCSFFNFRIVEEIINNVGSQQDKTNLKNYQEEFCIYAQRHIFECPSELGEMSEIGHANMFVTLDATYDCYTVSHLYAFVSNLQRVLKVPAVSLRLCRISPGSLKMTFQLLLSVQQSIFPLSGEQEESLTGLGVLQLSCGDYQFTAHGNEDSTANEESDHANSEDISVSENTCSAELAALGPILAVVTKKSDDSFSLADSALGWGSVSSFTTTGFTQFSEDLIDREMGDLDMEIGYDPTVSGYLDKNELHRASRRGDVKEVKRLVEESQLNPLENVSEAGMTALHYAAVGGQIGVMRYFAEERGYNPAIQTPEGWTCLHIAAQCNHYDLVQYLVDRHKIDPMCRTMQGDTPLHRACVGGNNLVVAYLLNAMSKCQPIEDILMCRGQQGWSPVHFAAYYGRLEVIKLLIIEFNFDALMTDNDSRIALHHAAQEGHLQIVNFLVERKCNPAHMDKKKVTPLHLAARGGHLNVVKYLTLEQHCNPLCTNTSRNTPLHSAAKRGKLEVVKFFIETLHCSPDVKGWRNKTPLQWANKNGHHHVVKYLESI